MEQEDFEAQAQTGECPVCAIQARKAQNKAIQELKTKIEQAHDADRGKMLNG